MYSYCKIMTYPTKYDTISYKYIDINTLNTLCKQKRYRRQHLKWIILHFLKNGLH